MKMSPIQRSKRRWYQPCWWSMPRWRSEHQWNWFDCEIYPERLGSKSTKQIPRFKTLLFVSNDWLGSFSTCRWDTPHRYFQFDSPERWVLLLSNNAEMVSVRRIQGSLHWRCYALTPRWDVGLHVYRFDSETDPVFGSARMHINAHAQDISKETHDGSPRYSVEQS